MDSDTFHDLPGSTSRYKATDADFFDCLWQSFDGDKLHVRSKKWVGYVTQKGEVITITTTRLAAKTQVETISYTRAINIRRHLKQIINKHHRREP